MQHTETFGEKTERPVVTFRICNARRSYKDSGHAAHPGALQVFAIVLVILVLRGERLALQFVIAENRNVEPECRRKTVPEGVRHEVVADVARA
jgi:hypothetical protein